MELKSLLVDSKTAWVDFPGLEGFSVELANLSRKELVNLRKKCLVNKFDRKSRVFNEELDEAKFVDEFTNATVKGWKGLKLGYLEDLILVDLKGQDPEMEMEYSHDNAKVLVENSSEFDNWLNEVVFDLEHFRSPEPKKVVKKLETFLDNKDIGMSKDQYLEMCAQMGQEPDWDKCPVDWEDFPDIVITGMNVYNTLGNRMAEGMGYLGKEYTNYSYVLEHFNVAPHQKDFVFK